MKTTVRNPHFIRACWARQLVIGDLMYHEFHAKWLLVSNFEIRDGFALAELRKCGNELDGITSLMAMYPENKVCQVYRYGRSMEDT